MKRSDARDPLQSGTLFLCALSIPLSFHPVDFSFSQVTGSLDLGKPKTASGDKAREASTRDDDFHKKIYPLPIVHKDKKPFPLPQINTNKNIQ